MRIIISLKNTKVVVKLEREYIRNLIYSCLRNSTWDYYHDKDKYKHICFSNPFPFNKQGQFDTDFKLIISSPDKKLIEHLKIRLTEQIRVVIGTYAFEVDSIKQIDIPKQVDSVMTATPIILRIPQKLYEQFGISSDKDSHFWTHTEVLNAFIRQLEKNLIARYIDYCESVSNRNTQSIPSNIFSTFTYKKTVYAWDKHFIGTMWQFGIKPEYQNHDLVRYMYEAGLGERNFSSGSGFLNLVSKV